MYYTVTFRRVRESLLQWKSSKYYLFICLRACVRACAGALACMWILGRVGVCVRIIACSLAYPARNAYAPCCDVICGPSGSTTFFDILINGAIFGKKSHKT